MYRVSTGASFGLRCGIVGLLSAVIVISMADQAEARWKRKYFKRQTAASATTSPRYADIVVDANTGDVLHDTNPDSQRHPASLTKIMTLYLLFERLESGKYKLDSQLSVSAHAASQAPTKLGLRPGQTIAVEDAIKALVTKSANDAAAVIGEAISGSEEEFAVLMTRKARALRMSRTIYKNASGLPDPDQVTTARDQALLGMAIQDRFPRYYRYFSTESFAYKGMRLRNHNRLLGSVNGVDGIKTGYTRASGFNLVTSVQRGGKRIVAVVLGGASGGARDARMRSLIEQQIVEASNKRTAPKIVEVAEATPAPQRPVRVASAGGDIPTKSDVTVSRRSETVSTQSRPDMSKSDMSKIETPSQDRPTAGSTEPIKPLLVKTLSVKPGVTKVAAVSSLLSPEPMSLQAPAAAAPATVPAPTATVKPSRETALPPAPLGARPGVLGVLTASDVSGKTTTASIAAPAVAPAPPPTKMAALAPVKESKPRSGWFIQVGAFDDQDEAKEKLDIAKTKASRTLSDADPVTETVAKGDKTLYRARFFGLKQQQAEDACRQLKRSAIACFAMKN